MALNNSLFKKSSLLAKPQKGKLVVIKNTRDVYFTLNEGTVYNGSIAIILHSKPLETSWGDDTLISYLMYIPCINTERYMSNLEFELINE